MFTLFDAHFDGVTRGQFDRDLEHKNWVVLIELNDILLGFSTILAFETHAAGELLTVIYSGDTIVAPAAWGSAAFPRAWIHAVYDIRRLHPNGRLIWLLLTSGFRTYRFLPVFWLQFYPRFDEATPPAWQSLIDGLADRLFGSGYDASTGRVVFDNPQQLRGQLRNVPESRAIDPHVAFFLSQNPRHARGDELVCAAELSPDNLTPAGRRVVYGAKR